MFKQGWVSKKVEIRKSPIAGKGMFALKAIRDGEKIVEFGGNYISKNDVDRFRRLGKIIMQWDENVFSYEDRGDDDDYFINHSCDPNTWMSDAFTLVARKPIQKDEEITVDYSLWEYDETFVTSWTCHCGAQDCRKIITGNDWKNPLLQKRYRMHFSPLINKSIAQLAQ